MTRKRQSSTVSNLATLGLMAPMVAASRTAGFVFAPLENGHEASRMVTEKIAATVESIARVQEATVGMWLGAAFGHVPTPSEAQAALVDAALAPYAKRVRANARRLSGKKK